MRKLAIIDTMSGVLHLDIHALAGDVGANFDFSEFRFGLLHGLDRVDDEIDDDLLDLHAIDEHLRIFLAQIQPQLGFVDSGVDFDQAYNIPNEHI